MLVKQNVNNDVTKDLPINYALVDFLEFVISFFITFSFCHLEQE